MKLIDNFIKRDVKLAPSNRQNKLTTFSILYISFVVSINQSFNLVLEMGINILNEQNQERTRQVSGPWLIESFFIKRILRLSFLYIFLWNWLLTFLYKAHSRLNNISITMCIAILLHASSTVVMVTCIGSFSLLTPRHSILYPCFLKPEIQMFVI